MEKYIKYVSEFQDRNIEEVQKWVSSNLANYLKTNTENQDEIEHIIDYLCSEKAPKRLKKMSYDEAVKGSEKWLKYLTKERKKIVETENDTEDFLIQENGFKWVKLVSEQSYINEGIRMSHCVGSYYGKNVNIYSLRDSNNEPHCTIEEDNQIKGKGNGSIHPKYIGYVVNFLEYLGMTVSDNEMKNLGYFNFSEYKEDIHKDSLKLAYKEYLPISSKILDVEGNDFFDLGLIDVLGLIDNEGKIIIDLKKLDYGIKRLLKNASSGDYSQNASSGNYSKNASSGNNSQNASSGYYSKNASSGDYSQNASSGYYSKNASSGDYSQNASSGDYSQNASSGDYSKNASSGYNSKNASSGYNSKNSSSGDYSKNASSGNNSQNASSGDYSKNASSGNNSQNASSGDYSQNASSGYYSQNASSGDFTVWEITGEKNVVASIGFKDKVKAVIGTWVTLAEYEEINGVYECINVVSKRIDGVELKENVYYTLENGKFKEVE